MTAYDFNAELMLEITVILLVAAMALWAYFALVLGPTLWKTNRRAFAFDLTVGGIVYGWLLSSVLISR